MKNLIQNWKTTSIGVSMIFGSIVHIIFAIKNHTADENSWIIFGGAILGGLAAMFAGDANVSANATETVAKTVDKMNALGTDPGLPPVATTPTTPPKTP